MSDGVPGKPQERSISFVTGEKTCASTPGEFCRWVGVKSFGMKHVCMLFGDARLFENEPGGWLMRCQQCLDAFRQVAPAAVRVRVEEAFAVEVGTPSGPVLVRTAAGAVFYEERADAEYVASRERLRVARVVEFVRRPNP